MKQLKFVQPALCALALLATPVRANGPANERRAVIAAVDRYIAAINSNDAQGYADAQVASGMTFSQRYQPDGSVRLVGVTNAEWVERIRAEKSHLREAYRSPTILIHRDIAVFWAPYSFDIDGKRAHCGVDVFDLVKTGGVWKVANSMWTVEPDGCAGK